MGLDLGPVFLPATTAYDIAESQHRIDMLLGLMHPGAFQAHFHHQLVAAFHDPTPDRPALRLELWVLQLVFPFFQVDQIACNGICSRNFITHPITMDLLIYINYIYNTSDVNS